MIKLGNSLLELEVLGIGLKSPLEIDPATGDFMRVFAGENVKNCIIDLIGTLIGERLMSEDIGTGVSRALFESQEAVIDILPHQVIEAINQHETRVTRATATAVPQGQHTVNLHVRWLLRSTGTPGSLVYPYNINPAAGGLAQ